MICTSILGVLVFASNVQNVGHSLIMLLKTYHVKYVFLISPYFSLSWIAKGGDGSPTYDNTDRV